MFNETWADQHARLLRSHRRLQRALARRSEPDDADYDPLDALYHFCCDVLHLATGSQSTYRIMAGMRPH